MRIKRRGLAGPHGLAAFSLVEVIVATAIITLLGVSLYLAIEFGFAVTDFERQNLRATQVILERMEGIRLLNWNQIPDTSLNPQTFVKQYYPAVGTNPPSGVFYTGQVTVASVNLDPAASYSTNMLKVTVTVTWPSGLLTRKRTASTYVARNGIQNYIYSGN